MPRFDNFLYCQPIPLAHQCSHMMNSTHVISIYAQLGLFVLASLQALTIALAAALTAASPPLAKHTSTLPYLGPCPTAVLLAFIPAALVSLVWLVWRDAAWAWVLQDIQGIAFMLLIFRTLRISSIKVGRVMLVGRSVSVLTRQRHCTHADAVPHFCTCYAAHMQMLLCMLQVPLPHVCRCCTCTSFAHVQLLRVGLINALTAQPSRPSLAGCNDLAVPGVWVRHLLGVPVALHHGQKCDG